MTTWTDNLEVPHLDQNVAEPEVPENVAKDIFDEIFAGYNTTDFLLDEDLTFVYVPDPKLAQPWHSFAQNFIDDTTALTATRTVTFPANKRPYLLINNTDQTLEFIVSGSSNPISLANGGANMYCYSDGTDLIKMEFDVSSMSGGTLSGTTTNSGTIDGGIISDAELIDFSFTRQAVTSGSAPDFDLSSGSIITYTNTETVSPTFTTTQTDTSFKLLITNGEAFVITWPSVSWAGGTKPTLTASGVDLLEFHRINSVWYGTVIDLNVS